MKRKKESMRGLYSSIIMSVFHTPFARYTIESRLKETINELFYKYDVSILNWIPYTGLYLL